MSNDSQELVPERQLAGNRENGTDWMRVPVLWYLHDGNRLPARVGDSMTMVEHPKDASLELMKQDHILTRREGREQEF
jgi:hypothetical protein